MGTTKISDVRERPILFLGPMVQAILDDRKTETRRVIKPQPGGKVVSFDSTDGQWYSRSDGRYIDWLHRCPFGQPGDRLWVREAWKVVSWDEEGNVQCFYKASPDITWCAPMAASNDPWVDDPCDWTQHDYDKHVRRLPSFREIDDPESEYGMRCEFDASELSWRPSIHMPRWASRITLEVVAVRVERVQDISEEDAVAEGVDAVSLNDVPRQATWSRRQDFAQLWNSINAKRGFGWDTNPWVWVIEFKTIREVPDGR